jgi:hypothetical protein
MDARPPPRALRLTRPEPREADVLSAILRTLGIHPAVVWYARMNTGSGKLTHANGVSQWIRFGFPGCPDILGQLKDGRLLGIEVKRPSGVVRPEQQAFINKATAGGAVVFIARSVDDVWDALNAEGIRYERA